MHGSRTRLLTCALLYLVMGLGVGSTWAEIGIHYEIKAPYSTEPGWEAPAISFTPARTNGVMKAVDHTGTIKITLAQADDGTPCYNTPDLQGYFDYLIFKLRVDGEWIEVFRQRVPPQTHIHNLINEKLPRFFPDANGGIIDGFDIDSERGCLEVLAGWPGDNLFRIFFGDEADATDTVEDVYSLQHDSALTSATSVLVNDPGGLGIAASGGQSPELEYLFLEAAVHTSVSHGYLEFHETGHFFYRPNPGFCGWDHFDYLANYQGASVSNVSFKTRVWLQVTCPPSAPPTIRPRDVTLEATAETFNGVVIGDRFDPGPGEWWQTLIQCRITDMRDSVGVFYVPFFEWAYPAGPNNDQCHINLQLQPGIRSGSVQLKLQAVDSGGKLSEEHWLTVTVLPPNNPPEFVAHDAETDEDAGAQAGVMVGDGFVPGPPGESDTLAACNVTDLSVPAGLLDAGPTVSVVGSECHLAYTPAADAFGAFSFQLSVEDSGRDDGFAENDSAPQTVTVTINPVNDPPVITAIADGRSPFEAQGVDYSDGIETVTIAAHDIDSPASVLSLELATSALPAGLSPSALAATTTCTDRAAAVTGTGQDCTWTLDGRVLEAAGTHDIAFSATDGGTTNDCAAAPNVCSYALIVRAENATVQLDAGNPSFLLEAQESGASGAFTLFFSAWETSDPEDNADSGSAAPGDLNGMTPTMDLLPAGAGAPISGACGFDGAQPNAVDGYGQVAHFACAFSEVPVDTYEVKASVGEPEDPARYFSGTDSAVFVVQERGSFTVGGTISGLNGTGLLLRLTDGDDLPVDANGVFAFATTLLDGSAFEVTVAQQPGTPIQSCTVTGGTGSVDGAPITSVMVSCADELFSVGGRVDGLGADEISVQLNDAMTLVLEGDGDFSFPMGLAEGMAYVVSISQQPRERTRRCVIRGGTGSMPTANVSAVVITCSQVGADLSVAITDERESVVPGTPQTYFLTVANAGPTMAVGAGLRVALPSALRDVTWICTPGAGASCPGEGADALDILIDLEGEAELLIVITGMLEATFLGQLEAVATITPPDSVVDTVEENNAAMDRSGTDAVFMGDFEAAAAAIARRVRALLD